PFVEPDLAVGVSGAVAMGRLKATTETPEADAYIIAVPTPFNGDRTANLSYVEAAAKQIAPRLSHGNIVVLEYTSTPGTTGRVAHCIGEMRPVPGVPSLGDTGVYIFVASCPERVVPVRIMIELVTNVRVVGGLARKCAERVAS